MLNRPGPVPGEGEGVGAEPGKKLALANPGLWHVWFTSAEFESRL